MFSVSFLFYNLISELFLQTSISLDINAAFFLKECNGI